LIDRQQHSSRSLSVRGAARWAARGCCKKRLSQRLGPFPRSTRTQRGGATAQTRRRRAAPARRPAPPPRARARPRRQGRGARVPRWGRGGGRGRLRLRRAWKRRSRRSAAARGRRWAQGRGRCAPRRRMGWCGRPGSAAGAARSAACSCSSSAEGVRVKLIGALVKLIGALVCTCSTNLLPTSKPAPASPCHCPAPQRPPSARAAQSNTPEAILETHTMSSHCPWFAPRCSNLRLAKFLVHCANGIGSPNRKPVSNVVPHPKHLNARACAA
jgi:hypothetical protein